jgi:hypothetical protein
MAVHLEKQYDGYVLHYTFTDPLDLNDLVLAYQEERRIRDATPHTVNGLVDFRKLTTAPKNWLAARNGPGLSHPRSGQIVIVGMNTMLKILVDTIMSVAKFKRIKTFDTIEAAHEYISVLVTDQKAAYQASLQSKEPVVTGD